MLTHHRYSMPLAGIAILAFVSLASAGTITATLNGLPQFRYVNVTIQGTDINSVWTGQIDWQRTGGDDPGPPTGAFHTFCIELNQDVSPGNSYTYQRVALEGVSYLTAPAIDALNELWGRHCAQVQDADTSAAFQIAVWEIVNDVGRRLGDGDFRVRYTGEAPPAYYSIAQQWLDSLDGNGPHASVAALIDPLAQDQITASPLPSAAWAGLGLLLALAAHRVRRSLRSAA